MPVAVCALSHSPLIGFNHPAKAVEKRVEMAFDQARSFIAEFDPNLVVLFAPDHYNGFFYDMMPQFCIGTHATALGDYNTPAGELSVAKSARTMAKDVLAAGIDIAVSERMYVDHGFSQPLQILFDGLDKVPVVPIFINSVATPLCPVGRIRQLGTAVGHASAHIAEQRVLFLGSGGLSHDPPVPQLENATEEVAARLIDGRNPTPEERARRQARVIASGLELAAGTSSMRPINPEWDRQFLDLISAGELQHVDAWDNAWFAEQAGNSSHEVRTWIAAYAAMAARGNYVINYRFYEPVPEWVAGFAVTTAVSADA
ncbi:2,3-dihydroxyphenylpropionate 1,2-dioxygenase [Amycolatopsis marina]|uniref:2,3-dihydroxyphenylpropionate/2,3-dihydroxicinnamic acid 1,2-dioxygenase n=1 Tax=Amycolatopsis marina TaxID=490629 RepID=A0A1I1BUY5_9PSEU|nr:3-carboxyethylcatechol 2,3-dioxygenase [Amycolatopsis marina]SFB53506.1 2,3-dihydroxyphenylpropionate 1,2-dioxygenase [Amycolatopsis marina]